MVRANPGRYVAIRIDLQKFIENASLAGIRLSPDQATDFLRTWGFEHCANDVWTCEPDRLNYLTPDEIREIVSPIDGQLGMSLSGSDE